jgi:hypothetical protein
MTVLVLTVFVAFSSVVVAVGRAIVGRHFERELRRTTQSREVLLPTSSA